MLAAVLQPVEIGEVQAAHVLVVLREQRHQLRRVRVERLSGIEAVSEMPV